jgi:hypothetical protein
MMTSMLVWSVLGLNVATLEATLLECPDQSGRVAGIPPSRNTGCGQRPTLTTNSGMPVADNQNSITAGPRGHVLMQDFRLLERLAHQNRERIPERTVHATGSVTVH